MTSDEIIMKFKTDIINESVPDIDKDFLINSFWKMTMDDRIKYIVNTLGVNKVLNIIEKNLSTYSSYIEERENIDNLMI